MFPAVTDAAPITVSPLAWLSGSSRRRASATAFSPQRTASSLSSLTIWAYARIPYAVASSALGGNASSVSTADRLAASASALRPTVM